MLAQQANYQPSHHPGPPLLFSVAMSECGTTVCPISSCVMVCHINSCDGQCHWLLPAQALGVLSVWSVSAVKLKFLCLAKCIALVITLQVRP